MKSWKTTISGACAAAGAALLGVPFTLTTLHITLPDKVTQIFAVIGIIMTVAGTFCAALFAADGAAVTAVLNKNNLNTMPLTPEEAKDTAPSPPIPKAPGT